MRLASGGADLSEPEQVGPVFERIAGAFGRVDFLVANAAATAFRPVLESTEIAKVRRTLCGFCSFVAMAQAAVPLMRGASELGPIGITVNG